MQTPLYLFLELLYALAFEGVILPHPRDSRAPSLVFRFKLREQIEAQLREVTKDTADITLHLHHHDDDYVGIGEKSALRVMVGNVELNPLCVDAEGPPQYIHSMRIRDGEAFLNISEGNRTDIKELPLGKVWEVLIPAGFVATYQKSVSVPDAVT